MDRFFNSDNRVMRILSKIFDLAWLSIIYIVFCIPVVTFGAATTSLYYVSAKVIRHDRSYVWREFWHCFKTNFVQSTLVWVIFAVLYTLMIFNIRMVGLTDSASNYGGYMSGAYIAITLVAFCIMCYIFAVISRFTMKIGGLFKFSMFLAFRHFLHTLILLAIWGGAIFLLVVGVTFGVPYMMFLVPGICGLLYTFPVEHLFKKYMPKADPVITDEGDEIVEWYNE